MVLREKLPHIFLFIITFSFAFGNLQAQPSALLQKNIIFNDLPDHIGLSEPTINCILQDKKGYLWIGTWSGLIRYNGYASKTYYSNNQSEFSLKSNKITALIQDREGFIWVGTHKGGLFKFDPSNEQFLQYKFDPSDSGSISNDNIWALLEDEKGRIWIGTENGLNIYDQQAQSFVKYFSSESDTTSLSHNFITDIHQSRNGNIWIATEYGINKSIFSGDKLFFSRKTFSEGQNNAFHNYFYNIDDVTIDGSEVLWMGTKKGLKQYRNGKFSNFLVKENPSGSNLFRAVKAIEGEDPLLLVGSEKGLNIFDPVKNHFIDLLINDPQQANLSHSNVTSIYLDQNGVLWVGTKRGLSKFDTYGKDFKLFKTKNFDPTESIVTGIQESEDGQLWISTMGGGLFRFNGNHNNQHNPISFNKRFKIKSKEPNYFTDFIQSLYIDSKDRVWFGTAGDGIYTFNEKELKPVNDEIQNYTHYSLKSNPAIPDDYVMSFSEDAEGNIWVGTWSGGLAKISSEGNVKGYKHKELLQAPLVVLVTDHNGTLWAGTRGNGLIKIEQQKDSLVLQRFNEDKGLDNLFVNAIYEDENKTLWIGTEDGLYYGKNNSDSIVRYDLHAGMREEVIVGILSDKKGRLWLSHWEGITVFNPKHSSMPMRNFDRQDRIQGGFFYSNSCIKNQNGNLIFGGSNGFNIINPDEDRVNPVQPQVIIQEIQVNNEPFYEGRSAEAADIIRLNYSENSVSFEFAALHFAAPEKIKYAYKLDGFDENWYYTGSDRRFANYTNLPSGKYQFLVNSTNSDGIWSDEYTHLSLVVSPPWWKTDWAVILYVTVFVLILFAFRRIIIIRTNYINDLKLERIQRTHIENVNKAKLDFFTNISHEFRTPLTLIVGPLQRIKDAGINDINIRQQLNIIDANTQRLLRLVNQLLDFRKAESGSFKLNVARGDLLKFIREIKLSFEGLASKNNIDFQLKTHSKNLEAWFDRDQFEKIIYNLLHNAFKNTPEGGKIFIEVVEEENEIQILVTDNGKGIKAEDLEHVFERFYSGKDQENTNGTGIGLALTKSLVELHGGKIFIESEENQFTKFSVNIPKGADHFNKRDFAIDVNDSEQIAQYTLLNNIEEETKPTEKEIGNEFQHSILIVEDNHEVRNYTISVFNKEYRIIEAENGREGLQKAQEEQPDIIISDVMMPVMDGINLCKELKKNIKTSHIPVILLTARTPLIFKFEGLETGADDYITKPFDPKILQIKVRNFIKLQESIRNSFTDNQTLKIEPSRVTLTSTDEKFIKGALESIEKNMDNTEYSVEDLASDVCMSRMQLYRKIKALTGQSANEFIRTIRLKRAAQLLEQNQLTIAEVTYQVGFSDLKYFRACFKKQFGVNPSNYSSKLKEEVVSK